MGRIGQLSQQQRTWLGREHSGRSDNYSGDNELRERSCGRLDDGGRDDP